MDAVCAFHQSDFDSEITCCSPNIESKVEESVQGICSQESQQTMEFKLNNTLFKIVLEGTIYYLFNDTVMYIADQVGDLLIVTIENRTE